MKILYVCPDTGIPVLGGKGGAVHVREMVAAFVRAGHQVVLAAPFGRKSPWEAQADVAGKFLHIPIEPGTVRTFHALSGYLDRLGASDSLARDVQRMLYDGELAKALVEDMRSDPPDFVYSRASTFSIAAVDIARQLRRPLVLELNAPLAAEQATYRAGALADIPIAAERLVLNRANAVVVVSASLRSHVESLGVPAERIHVMPNGIDPSVFRPAPRDQAVRARWGLPERAQLLGFVGGLRPWHGVDTLPDVLARLSNQYPDACLAIVGDGPLRSELDKALARLSLAGRAYFTGAVSHGEVPQLMREFDVAVAPYPALAHDFYFSPLKLFEYMACGAPVVAPRVGQIAEVVHDGETGVLYEPGSVDALAEACGQLLGSVHMRKRIGASAAQLMHSSYTWDHNAARVVALVEQIGA